MSYVTGGLYLVWFEGCKYPDLYYRADDGWWTPGQPSGWPDDECDSIDKVERIFTYDPREQFVVNRSEISPDLDENDFLMAALQGIAKGLREANRHIEEMMEYK